MGSAAAPRVRLLTLLPTLKGGGAERVVLNLLRHLDTDRFDPTLAVVDSRDADLTQELPPNLRVVDLQCSRVSRAVPAIIRTVRTARPHVLLSTLSHLNLALAMARPLLPAGLCMVARESNTLSHLVLQERYPRLWRAAHRLFYPRLDRFICQSEAMRDDLCAQFRVAPDRAVVIPNPLDLERIWQAAGTRTVAGTKRPTRLVAVGRLSPQKGFDHLLSALATCHDLPIELDLLGQGPEEARLRHQIATLGLQSRVRLLGFQSNPYPSLRNADALVLASRFEGLPNVVLEALACGTPVITTPVPAALEIARGLPPGCFEIASDFTTQALASALRAWMTGPRQRVAEGAMAAYAAPAITRRYENALIHAAGL
jgi:glycosyltransferase involved in cell wall biosynthesis